MESVPDVASNLLNFAQTKRRAVSSRCYRIKVPTSNGQVFNPGQTMNLDLGGSIQSTYYDFGQSYFKMTITNNGAATPADDCCFDGNSGAYSMINRMQCITGGQTISDIQQFNVLASALMTQNVNANWQSNVGQNLIGCGVTGARQGQIIPGAGGSITVCLPFICTALSGTTPTRYVPAFSRDSLRFRLYLESLVSGVCSSIAGQGGAPVLVVSETEAVMYCVELSPAAQSLVGAMTGNVYNILCNDWRTANGSFTGAAAPLTTVQTLGFSVSSLERVLIVHRNNATVIQNANSVGSRSTATLQEFQLLINGQSFPERPILYAGTAGLGAGAETLAETLVAQHALSDFGHDSSLAKSAGVATPGVVTSSLTKFNLVNSNGLTEATTGTFMCAIELESMAGKSDTIYSGISTVGAVVQYRGVYTAPAVGTFDLSFFAQNTILLTLDMNGLGTFIVSV